MAEVTYGVTGMTCGHCVHAVTEEVGAIEGVVEVNVELAPKGTSHVTITSDHPLDEEQIRAAVDEAGYELAGVTG